ncbi:NarL/FixJ-like response regulator [Pontimonas salivibrio]|uniref:NarL/FixJ-like response regulator n=1 Tax=Pontimonas salivibrio TaxID=1159327 RepID=A0A2L2BRT4_9MICO|nr:response regulator transcription factor [Pontimonas salivibrio]AVG24394.1 NarL/FixJ-like response regulator [Pontimonas salivibrio]
MVLRIGMVEDDALLRLSITEALEGRDGCQVVTSSDQPKSIIDAVRAGALDVALLDVHLGNGPSGFDIAQSLRRITPGLGIVFLSSVRDPRLLGYNPASLPKGARYLLKSDVDDIDMIEQSLRAAAHDGYALSDQAAPRVDLTQPQIDILRLVARGLSNAEIARERVVTERAVEVAVSRLAKHLNLRETPGLNQRVHIAARFFKEMGWTP